MELWSVVIPILKITFYIASLGTTGTVLFLIHFKSHLSGENFVYCSKLIKNGSILGAGISAASFFSIAGNMGGDLKSAFK